jgi:hypothetical protein
MKMAGRYRKRQLPMPRTSPLAPPVAPTQKQLSVDVTALQEKMEQLEQVEVNCTSLRSMLQVDCLREMELLVKSLGCEELEDGEWDEMQSLRELIDLTEQRIEELNAEMASLIAELDTMVGRQINWSFIPTCEIAVRTAD